jgi:hypothetical protein
MWSLETFSEEWMVLKMADKEQLSLDSLEYEEVIRIDKDGNAVTVKVY